MGRATGVPCTLNLEPRANIKPGQDIAVLTDQGWSMMRWGIIPVGRVNARGRPVMETLINARSETVLNKTAYQGVKRAIVPISGWYEWTGEKRKKTPWNLSLKSGDPLVLAAIWDTWNGPGGVTLDQVATLTQEPNKDVAPIHHRMGVFLEGVDIDQWLTGDGAVPTKTLGEGLLRIEKETGVDWNAD